MRTSQTNCITRWMSAIGTFMGPACSAANIDWFARVVREGEGEGGDVHIACALLSHVQSLERSQNTLRWLWSYESRELWGRWIFTASLAMLSPVSGLLQRKGHGPIPASDCTLLVFVYTKWVPFSTFDKILLLFRF